MDRLVGTMDRAEGLVGGSWECLLAVKDIIIMFRIDTMGYEDRVAQKRLCKNK